MIAGGDTEAKLIAEVGVTYRIGAGIPPAYRVEGGEIDSIPDWQTDELFFGVDIVFVDIDLDGDLDLALGGRNMGIAIFYNNDGVIETTPSWHTYEIIGGRQIAFADVDGDGYDEVLIGAAAYDHGQSDGPLPAGCLEQG